MLKSIILILWISLLIKLSIDDFENQYVDLKDLISLFLISLVFTLYIDLSLLDKILGTLFVGITMVIINQFYLSFGEADIYLMMIVGFILGLQKSILAFVLSIYFAVFYCLIKKQEKNDTIPFIPFLCLGILCSYFVGETILAFYFHLF